MKVKQSNHYLSRSNYLKKNDDVVKIVIHAPPGAYPFSQCYAHVSTAPLGAELGGSVLVAPVGYYW